MDELANTAFAFAVLRLNGGAACAIFALPRIYLYSGRQGALVR